MHYLNLLLVPLALVYSSLYSAETPLALDLDRSSPTHAKDMAPLWNERARVLEELQFFEHRLQTDPEIQALNEQIKKLQTSLAQRTQTLLEAQSGYLQKHDQLVQLEQKLGIRPDPNAPKIPIPEVVNSRAQALPEIPPPSEVAPKAQTADDF